jgi:uncharacterized protein (TIGR00251 family)
VKERPKHADRRADSRTATVGDRPAWLRQDGDGVLIFVHLQPGARRTARCGEHGGRLKIAVAAPPLEGRANEALTAWIAAQLDVPRRHVSVISGLHSRDKTVRADGTDVERVLRCLARE